VILKIKNGNNWTFLDNVESATKIIKTELEPSEFIEYERKGEMITQNVSEGCYLLNDTGKTIEKLV
jgi:hypothetical protein